MKSKAEFPKSAKPRRIPSRSAATAKPFSLSSFASSSDETGITDFAPQAIAAQMEVVARKMSTTTVTKFEVV
jgi:hypothetical protein